MSPLQPNYREPRINAKVLNGQNNFHVDWQTRIQLYHIKPLSLSLSLGIPPIPPAFSCYVTFTKCILDLLTTTHFDYIRYQTDGGGKPWEARRQTQGGQWGRHLLVCLIGFVFILVFNYI